MIVISRPSVWFCPLLTVLVALSTSVGAAAQTGPGSTALVGARVIDGTGKVIERGTILVNDGKIAQVGPADQIQVPSGAQRIDLAGLTVIPGLINAHGHLTAVVGLTTEKTGYTRENLERQLRTYAQYGITTVFSLGDDQEEAFALRNEQATTPLRRSRLFVGGPIVQGASAEAARAATDKVAAMKPDLLKIRVDDNLGTSSKMPEAAWRATIARGDELKLPVAVHIYYLADAKAVLAAGADMIAHSVRDLPVDAEFISALKARNVCYSPTLMREVSTFVYAETPVWAKDPFFLRGYSQAIAEELANPERHARTKASGAYKQGLQYKAGLEVAKRNLKTLKDQGVLIAMGTDTGPAGRFQGFFEHLELEMMVDAGMTPMEALVSATGAAARCHGKVGQIGTIQPGAAADFVVLTANPLQDIKATRAIQGVWIAGQKIF
jgi:imidazolonepropionase-like amidohydrolase